MVFVGGTAECPVCGGELSVSESEFRYARVSHSRECPWLKIDRKTNRVIVDE